MITPIDVRIRFKQETGLYPVWPMEHNTRFSLVGHELTTIKTKPDNCVFYGKLRTEYGQWLEEKLGDSDGLRNLYLRNTGFRAVKARIKMIESLRSDYSEWLEEKYIKRNA
jgi:hypothetical protein